MTFKIGNKSIGKEYPCFIVAELSANHLHDFELAKRTITAAHDAGADAVKLQTYTPDTITIDCDNDYFKIQGGTVWDGKTLYQLYKEAYTPWEWHKELKEYAEKLGLIFFSTPFDKSAVDFLYDLGVPAFKIASQEITDIPLIEYIASKGKPVIISTGIALLSDINKAVDTCRKIGTTNIALLKCTSSYPAPLEELNLRTIEDMLKRFNIIVGFSDHTFGSCASIAAVTLGASIVEKHLILDRNLGGPDASFSSSPGEFRQMVTEIRNTEKALGKITYKLSKQAEKNRKYSRSLFIIKDIKKGECFTSENVASIRPGDGLPPERMAELLGKRAKYELKRGTPLSLEVII